MFALPGFTARATIVLPWEVSGGHFQAEKKPRAFARGFMFALPGFAARATILCR